jgi:hypothetical protein
MQNEKCKMEICIEHFTLNILHFAFVSSEFFVLAVLNWFGDKKMMGPLGRQPARVVLFPDCPQGWEALEHCQRR